MASVNGGRSDGTPPADPDAVPVVPAGTIAHRVDIDTLAEIRALITALAGTNGLAGDPLSDIVLAVNELATNVVRHGGGHGTVQMWSQNGFVFCRMSDGGPGMPVGPRGYDAPSPAALTGRGLWMIDRMTDYLRIESGPSGTTVTIAVRA